MSAPQLKGGLYYAAADHIQSIAINAVAPVLGQALVYNGTTWGPAAVAPGGPAGGDLSGTYPNPTVAKINGSSVPVGGALTTGNVLQVTGVATLSYAAVNLGGGANFVTGLLPAANQASQTMGGDVTGVTATNTVVSLTGAAGVVTAPAASLAFGATPATAGTVRLSSAQQVSWRNAANTSNVPTLTVNVADQIVLGTGGANSTLTLPTDGTGALITVSLDVQTAASVSYLRASGSATSASWQAVGSGITSFTINYANSTAVAGTAGEVLIAAQRVTVAASTGGRVRINGGAADAATGGPVLINGGVGATASQSGYVSITTGGDEAARAVPGNQFNVQILGVGGFTGTQPTVTSGTGVPVSTPANGSLYMRTDGASGADGLYTRQGAAWFPIGAGASGITQLTGDVTAGPGSGSQAATVVRINGATVPAAGALTTGNVLQVTGASALSYAPINLAGGANFVTGALPVTNLAVGTAAQALITNAGATAAAWTTFSGDVSPTAASPGLLTVVALQTRAVANTAPTNNQALIFNTGAAQWQPTTITAALTTFSTANQTGVASITTVQTAVMASYTFVRSVAASYTVDTTGFDGTLLSTAAGITFTLPTAASWFGRKITLKDTTGSGAGVVFSMAPVAGDKVDGVLGTATFSVPLGAVTLQSDGVLTWWVV